MPIGWGASVGRGLDTPPRPCARGAGTAVAGECVTAWLTSMDRLTGHRALRRLRGMRRRVPTVRETKARRPARQSFLHRRAVRWPLPNTAAGTRTRAAPSIQRQQAQSPERHPGPGQLKVLRETFETWRGDSGDRFREVHGLHCRSPPGRGRQAPEGGSGSRGSALIDVAKR